jgi:hypothetical protein
MQQVLKNFSLSNFGILGASSFAIFCVSFGFAHAQEFVPLVGIPNIPTSGNVGLPTYINGLYLLTIGVGSLIAVVKISIAGVKWAMSDVVTDKSSAKSDIKGALLGLAILLIPFIVLNTIYPGLTSLDVLKNASAVKVNLTESTSGTTPTTQPQPQTKTWPAGTTIESCTKASVVVCGGQDHLGNCVEDNSYYNATDCAKECSGLGGEFYDPGPTSATTQCGYKTPSTGTDGGVYCAGKVCAEGKTSVYIKTGYGGYCSCQ